MSLRGGTESLTSGFAVVDWLIRNANWIGVAWWVTLALMAALFALAIVAPYSKVTKALPLTVMFNPRENLNLNLQSVCYAMTHTTWMGRISHLTIAVDAFLWFVVLNHISPILGLAMLALMAHQASAIGEQTFSISFLLLGAVFYAGSLWLGHALGWYGAWLVSIAVLMTDGMIRFVGHWTEPAPPFLLDDSDQFIPITPRTANWKLALMPVYGYVAEVASGLPNRLFAVQVNYLCQCILGLRPKKTLSWEAINERAAGILSGGYRADEWMARYHDLVTGAKPNRHSAREGL